MDSVISNFEDGIDFFDQDIESDDSTFASPPENLWYHGRLDRYAAEERLLQAGRCGSFLIRESDRKPGSYVLSYLGNSGINHFRITAVCGDFYIGGRQFNSLSYLISYYMHCSDLLRKERLIYPIPPPEPVNDKKRVLAVLPYTKMPDTDELSFEKGDIFFVHNDMGDGWLWVTAHRTGEQGMIFTELVQDLDENIDPNTVFNWFHPAVSKAEAVDMLVKAGPGSFLVRPSDNSPGDYSLFFHVNNQIQRFRIEKRGVRYFMGGRTFECLDAVINRYRKEQIVEGHTLGNPICNAASEAAANGYGYSAAAKTKEIPHAEKIYESLRECREQVGLKKTKGIKMQSYLYRRNEKNKKWKNLYFVLSTDDSGGGAGESQLYFYDNPKRTKPKGLIDLTCAYLYQVHDSVFERPYCFQLVEKALPCLSTVTYLSASLHEIFQQWITVLRPLCVTQISRNIPHKLRELRTFNLHILDARRLPLKLVPNPFFVISLNQIKVAKTKVKNGQDPFWDEEFTFDDVPSDVLTFSLALHNKAKRSKENNEIAILTMELNSLKNGEEHENWHPLSGITPVGEWGSVRLRTQYLHDLIMPTEEYSPMQQLILESDFEAVKALSHLCFLDRLTLANALFKIFSAEHKLAELIKSLAHEEIMKEQDTSTLFRSTSLTSTLMDMYMKSVCTNFLQTALQDTIFKLLESKTSCDLNPEKMDPNDDACANAEFLLQILDDITLNIFMSAESCPKTLRHICGSLQRSAINKWPYEKLVRTRVVSGFIFLRLLCPALLNPRQFNITAETPPTNTTRSLVMIAKCLQNLANLIEFGSKEPYMEVVNPFILKNKERMIVFLDTLSNVLNNPETEKRTKGEHPRELAVLHHICVSHLEELQALSNSEMAIKKLVTVTEMLNKHKKKYIEMMA